MSTSSQEQFSTNLKYITIGKQRSYHGADETLQAVMLLRNPDVDGDCAVQRELITRTV